MDAAAVLSPAKRLMEHPLRGEVFFKSELRCFVRSHMQDGAKKLARQRGLKELLREVFWPTYNYERAQSVAERLARSTGVSGKPGSGVLTSVGGSKSYGRLRGEVVHEQVADCANLTREQFEAKHEWVHPFTYNVVHTLTREMGLSIVRAEEPVYSPSGEFASAIDILCSDSAGRLVAIELKCGLQAYATHANDMMKSRSLGGKFTNSPLNQAHVQLLAGAMMLREQYGIGVHSGYVLIASESGVSRYPIPAEMIARSSSMYAELVRYASRVLSDRKARARKRARHRMGARLEGPAPLLSLGLPPSIYKRY